MTLDVWPTVDPDKAWTERKRQYRETHPYGCRRCLRAGLRGDPDRWLDIHHVWGDNRIWPTGSEPDHALMFLCQPHHDELTRVHARFCRWWQLPKIMHGNTIRHPMLYSVTLGLFTYAYVLTGRALLTSAARWGFYLAGGWLALWLGPAFALAICVWPLWYLWRK